MKKVLPSIFQAVAALGLPVVGLYLGLLFLYLFNCHGADCSYDRQQLNGHIAIVIYLATVLIGATVLFSIKIPIIVRTLSACLYLILFIANHFTLIMLACSFYAECL